MRLADYGLSAGILDAGPARETPLHSVHLRNLLTLSDMGAVIAPPLPAFYARPGTIDDIVAHSVLRLLDQLAIHEEAATRWSGIPED